MQHAVTPRHTKSDKKFKIILITLISLIIIGLVLLLFLVFNSSSNTEDEQIDTEESTQSTEKVEEPGPGPSLLKQQKVDAAKAKLNLTTDFRKSLTHGTKTAAYQKYIVLHDTEGEGNASNVINSWDSNGKGVAAQFVVNKDGSIVQCVGIDEIAHHSGYGDTGHNAQYGVTEDGRDDMIGTQKIGSWASDYGMNAWSIGIEIVHVGGSGDYPAAQLQALDNLIAYIDAYYSDTTSGNGGKIIDHKMWRTGNSDTSKEFAGYLSNYQSKRTHQ